MPDAGRGVFFQAEWDHAMKVAPPILLVTGWNEWTASVWEKPGVVMLDRRPARVRAHIVDEFNMQFDRDIEPMAPTRPGEPAGYGDNYYWQFVQNMRAVQGRERPAAGGESGRPAADAGRGRLGRRDPRSTTTRSATSATRDWAASPPNLRYTDASARNDIATAQVATDGKMVVFRVTTAARSRRPTARTG